MLAGLFELTGAGGIMIDMEEASPTNLLDQLADLSLQVTLTMIERRPDELAGNTPGCHRRLHQAATRVKAVDVLYIARACQRPVTRTRPYRSR
jgi:hypothetical protein